MPEDRRAYSINEFCWTFGISRTMVYREIAKGNLSARKAGNRTLILYTDAEAWARSLPALRAARHH